MFKSQFIPKKTITEMKPSQMDVENIDDYDIQLMTQMENYIEQNYVSPDRSQILHMKRTREI